MKAVPFFLLQFFSFSFLFCQTIQWEFDHSSGYNIGYKMVVDKNEDLIISGITGLNNQDFDPDTSVSYPVSRRKPYARDAFIAKYDSTSDLKWVRTIGAADFDDSGNSILDMKIDNTDNIYVHGRFDDTLFFGPTYATTLLTKSQLNQSNGYFASYTAGGSLRWAYPLHDTLYSNALEMTISNQSEILLFGQFSSQVDVDFTSNTYFVNPDTNYMRSYYLAKYDQNANLKWAKALGYDCTGFPFCNKRNFYRAFEFDTYGNIVYHGVFTDSMDVDPGSGVQMLYSDPNHPQNKGYYVAKLDTSGNFLWAKQFNTPGGIYVRFQNYNGGYRLFGYAADSTDIDPDSTVELLDGSGLIIADYTSNLNYINHYHAPYVGSGPSMDLYYNKNDEPVIIGNYSGTFNYDFGGSNTYTSQSLSDIFIVRYRKGFTNGNVTQIGVNSSEYVLGAGLASDNSVYIGGKVNASMGGISDIEPGPDTHIVLCSSPNWFLARYKRGSYEDTNVTAMICPGDSILLGGMYRDTAGLYVDSFFTYLGGDSLVFTQLSIDTIHVTPLNVSICSGDSILIGGSYRQVGGLYSDTLSNFNGCDSILQINLSIDPLPVLNLGNDINACDNDKILINAYNPSIAKYRWHDNSRDSAYSKVYFESSGDSLIWLKITDTNGCKTSDTLNVFPNNLIGLLDIGQTFKKLYTVNFRRFTTPQRYDTLYWSFGDGQTAAGDSIVSHTYAVSGSYTVCHYAENECGRDSSCLNVFLTVGINENRDDFGIEIYPNPVTSELIVEFKDQASAPRKIIIYDAKGSTVVMEVKSKDNLLKINLSQLERGTYILEILQENQAPYRKKFIKTGEEGY